MEAKAIATRNKKLLVTRALLQEATNVAMHLLPVEDRDSFFRCFDAEVTVTRGSVQLDDPHVRHPPPPGVPPKRPTSGHPSSNQRAGLAAVINIVRPQKPQKRSN